jgi:hypothetical protein
MVVEVIAEPGATTSGLILPSSVGPTELLAASNTSKALVYPPGISAVFPTVRMFLEVE